MMSLEQPPEHWLSPWRAVDDGPGLAAELAREVGPGHRLAGVAAVAVALRVDCDDVLFALPAPHPPLAVVHLVWSGRQESDPHWPGTRFYHSWADWIHRCMEWDHADYDGDWDDPEDSE
ncbi:MAG: hypothetical protein M3Z04_10730 [Chloroflexota bacterium]|nr:hypothetical protein [Chloroflexota bacterium]